MLWGDIKQGYQVLHNSNVQSGTLSVTVLLGLNLITQLACVSGVNSLSAVGDFTTWFDINEASTCLTIARQFCCNELGTYNKKSHQLMFERLALQTQLESWFDCRSTVCIYWIFIIRCCEYEVVFVDLLVFLSIECGIQILRDFKFASVSRHRNGPINEMHCWRVVVTDPTPLTNLTDSKKGTYRFIVHFYQRESSWLRMAQNMQTPDRLRSSYSFTASPSPGHTFGNNPGLNYSSHSLWNSPGGVTSPNLGASGTSLNDSLSQTRHHYQQGYLMVRLSILTP